METPRASQTLLFLFALPLPSPPPPLPKRGLLYPHPLFSPPSPLSKASCYARWSSLSSFLIRREGESVASNKILKWPCLSLVVIAINMFFFKSYDNKCQDDKSLNSFSFQGQCSYVVCRGFPLPPFLVRDKRGSFSSPAPSSHHFSS